MPRDFRFAVGLVPSASRPKWQDAVRRVGDFGFDVMQVSDHVRAASPILALLAAAEVTSMRLGTYVLNAGLYKPALLARDIATLDEYSGGRVELGLGAGYSRAEYEAAGLPFAALPDRIEYLAHVTSRMRELLPTVPILIAGSSDRLVGLAARRADTVGLTGGPRDSTASDPLAERLEFVRVAAGERFDQLELNLEITGLPHDSSGVPDISLSRAYAPTLSEEELLRLPTVLSGSTRDVADTLRRYRDDYGLTYITVDQRHAESFGKVIAELR